MDSSDPQKSRPTADMPPVPRPPKRALPASACDAHVHLMGRVGEYPLWDGRIEDPAPGPDFEGWLTLYRQHLETMGFQRGLIVHSIFYGTDNTVTRLALQRLGTDFKGVGLLPDGATEADIAQFAADDMVAVRLNYVHGGVLSWKGALAMAPMLADYGLHIQMLLHADEHINDIADDIRALPVPLVVDHLGWPSQTHDPSNTGFQMLCALMSEGHVYTKLSAPYRMCNAPYAVMHDCTKALVQANAERCLWGSDWPHVMLNGAQMPQASDMLNVLDDILGNEATRELVYSANPARLFGWPTP